MSSTISPLNVLAASPAAGNNKANNTNPSWFEAMAEAWGKTLDGQANRIEELATGIGDGIDTPSAITQLTAESLKMGFMSNSSHTSLSSIAQGLETMARKQ